VTERERDRFVGDLVVATVVATWTRWVNLKVAARSRSGSLAGWSDLGVGCSHGGQIGSRVGQWSGIGRWSGMGR